MDLDLHVLRVYIRIFNMSYISEDPGFDSTLVPDTPFIVVYIHDSYM